MYGQNSNFIYLITGFLLGTIFSYLDIDYIDFDDKEDDDDFPEQKEKEEQDKKNS